MLALAREGRGYSQSELAEICGTSRSSISKYEQESLQLSVDIVKGILQLLKFPEALLGVTAELLPPAMYRKRDNVPAKLMTQIDAFINLYVLGIRKLLLAIQYQQPTLPLLPVLETGSAQESARRLRKVWKLPAGVIANLTEVLEAQGILTLGVDFGTERVDSRSILIDDKFPVIFYNKKLLGDRLRFTLAYELGHLVMHTRIPLTHFDNSHEANVFAAELLMPEKEISKDLSADIDIDLLAQLKSKWAVSMQSLLFRAQDLNIITDNQKRYVINRFNQLKIRKREPMELDIKVERGQLLRNLITKYRVKQRMNLSQIAEFFYLNEEEFLATYN
ncbi:MAG: ImmA/IrrE family metallo-endopeptidase [Bacteroidetes bacterium]|nr:ImmA/IrrE family metallo-endopeptidase [Bacteroidota bacterium]